MYDPELFGKVVQIRPSQKKFESEDKNLEVIRCATYSQGFLNRQIIMLMSCQGVPDEVFLGKLHQATKRLNTNYMVKKMYSRVKELAESKEMTEDRKKEIFGKIKIFFGPSR